MRRFFNTSRVVASPFSLSERCSFRLVCFYLRWSSNIVSECYGFRFLNRWDEIATIFPNSLFMEDSIYSMIIEIFHVSFYSNSSLIKQIVSVNQYEYDSFFSISFMYNSENSFTLPSYGGPIDRNLDHNYLVQNHSLPILISPKSRSGYSKVHLRSYSSSGDSIPNNKSDIDRFWEEVYLKMSSRVESVPLSEISESKRLVMDELDQFRDQYINMKKMIKKARYHNKYKEVCEGGLLAFQKYIENLTMSFNIDNLYNQAKPLFKMLTISSTNEPLQPARDYLKEKECDLDEYELKALNDMSHHINTIEAIIVHVFAILFSKNIFSNDPGVKLATLVQHLDDAIRNQFRLGKSNKKIIGRNLISFLLDREFISIVYRVVPFNKTKNHPKTYSYVECKFNLELLPLKLNLPMIIPPKKWFVDPKRFQKGKNIKLHELKGGYMTESKVNSYNRFSLLASRDTDHFNIIIKDVPGLCSILNNLQSKPFRINETMLNFILEYRPLLEEAGLLMDRRIAHAKMSDAYPVLRNLYYNNIAVREKYKNISELELEFSKRVQQARFEDFIIDLAKAYRGYEFYLPAFLDFRGRIYRSGILHFHERDIAKSLILFSNQMSYAPNDDKRNLLDSKIHQEINFFYSAAVAFKYKKHTDYHNAILWYQKNIDKIINDRSLIEFSKKASDPFQFLSKALIHKDKNFFRRYSEVPISQDASASAYQIMSYFLLHPLMALLTNLIPNCNTERTLFYIEDIYVWILSKLRTFLMEEMPKVFPVIEPRLDRKLVKSLFMPMIYGKTLTSMTEDIHSHYGDILNYKDCNSLSYSCQKYFKDTFPEIISFMKMINNIGSICAYTGKHVIYETEYLMTVQDYMKYDSETLTVKVYKKENNTKTTPNRKRPDVRKVTFRFPTSNRDVRKTGISTCVNFIHQKDAYIAMKLLSKFFHNSDLSIYTHNSDLSIYTVHDNFITPLINPNQFAQLYNEVFIKDLPHPLILVNQFILMNMRADLSEWELDKPIIDLKELIMNHITKHHKKVKTIEKKVDETVKLYNDYVKTVTQSNKYDEFKEYLSPGFYSLHY